MANNTDGNLKPTWLIILSLILSVIVSAAITYAITAKPSKYYQQLYNEQSTKITQAQHVIDSLSVLKLKWQSAANTYQVRIDSLYAAYLQSNSGHLKNKAAYDTLNAHMANWGSHDLDSLFARKSDTTGHKNR